MSPGVGDYCLGYGYIFKEFAKRGIAVHGFDRKGFGLSGGKRGEISETELEDHWDFIDHVLKTKGYADSIPRFVWGYSYGGLMALRLCQQRPNFFNGEIFLCPNYGPLHPNN